LPAKGGHRPLDRLIRIMDLRLPFVAQREQLVRQRQWLIDLDRLLDAERQEPPASGAAIAERVDCYLSELLASVAHSGDAWDQQMAAHINRTFRNRW